MDEKKLSERTREFFKPYFKYSFPVGFYPLNIELETLEARLERVKALCKCKHYPEHCNEEVNKLESICKEHCWTYKIREALK